VSLPGRLHRYLGSALNAPLTHGWEFGVLRDPGKKASKAHCSASSSNTLLHINILIFFLIIREPRRLWSCDTPESASFLDLMDPLATRLLLLLCQNGNSITHTRNQPTRPTREQKQFNVIHDQSQLSNKANFLTFIPGSKDSSKKNILD